MLNYEADYWYHPGPIPEDDALCQYCYQPVTRYDIDEFAGTLVHTSCADELNGIDKAIEFIIADTSAFAEFLKNNTESLIVLELVEAYKNLDRDDFEAWALG